MVFKFEEKTRFESADGQPKPQTSMIPHLRFKLQRIKIPHLAARHSLVKKVH
jgi:hypothetical protein